ncbi:DUF3880 domain-containing protein [Paenibacillus alginolyticus]|uniref:CgeB family protein n=1 Tax=Paenibacillus alginolyticus TaxID=59839 RepID=UPI00042360B5|nr:DUF3880 domain-containing protein [Paenibacillus alginolyticus]MCY9668272.1 DUF3880 domain-containing protein [Paenibacillus alginolyticus]
MSKTITANSTVGRERGFLAGKEHGVRMWRCQAVIDVVRPAALPLREAKVLFIVQGFDAIDGGISQGLQQTVREAYTATATDMVRLAEELRPDLVLVMNGLHLFPTEHKEHVEQVKLMGIRTAIWFADDPYFTDHTASLAPHYDYVFTHELSCLALYREIGCQQVHYLPLAVNTSVYKPMHVAPEYRSLAGSLWDQLRHYSLLEQGIKLQWIPIEESVKYYNGAKIVMNVHRLSYDETYNKNSKNLPGHSINPRTYEISACGTLQITDYRHDLDQYYTPGHDIETFDSAEELIQKMQHYLIHEEDRMRIAMPCSIG